jgi:hypothetical protein
LVRFGFFSGIFFLKPFFSFSFLHHMNTQERLARFLEAFVFVAASKTRNIYKILFNPDEEPADKKGDSG